MDLCVVSRAKKKFSKPTYGETTMKVSRSELDILVTKGIIKSAPGGLGYLTHSGQVVTITDDDESRPSLPDLQQRIAKCFGIDLDTMKVKRMVLDMPAADWPMVTLELFVDDPLDSGYITRHYELTPKVPEEDDNSTSSVQNESSDDEQPNVDSDGSRGDVSSGGAAEAALGPDETESESVPTE